MTQIKIEVPANDHIALSAMADALQRIASERDPSVTTGDAAWKQMDKIYAERGGAFENTTTEKEHDENMLADVEPVDELDEIFAQAKQTLSTINDMVDDGTLIRPDRDEELEASIHHENTKHDEAFEEAVESTLDADGIPHDKRIHSKGATRLADNTWRLRKRPADKTEEEWTSYIDSVKAELKAVQDIPTLDEQCDNTGIVRQEAETPTLDEQAVADLTPPVIDTDTPPVTPPVIDTDTPQGMSEANETPVAPVTPPTSLTQPVVEAASDKPSVTTFQELMLYITGNAKKRGADNDMIKATLAEVDPALTAIPLIATRADLIPKFVTALEAKLS